MTPDNPLTPSPSKTKRSWRTYLAWLSVLLILAVGGYWYSRPSEPGTEKSQTKGEKRENAPVTVALVTTRMGDMPIYLSGLGTVTALRTVTVHSRVDGELIHVAFKEGQFVKQGDLLAEIDPRPFQVQLKQAEGQLLRDQALLKNAELDMSRYQTLLDQDSIASQQTATQAALVKQYQGAIAMDQAQVDNAKLQLVYARITAPIPGRIGLRLVDQGNIVHAADSNGLLVITQTQPITVVFTLPEDSVPAIMKRWHSSESITVEAYDRAGNLKLASGKILAVDNQIDTSTGTLKLKAQFENTDQSLFANQFVNIKMKLDILQATILTATATIQRGVNGAFVYVAQADNTVSVRPVKIGPVDGENTAILEGLSAGEKLVIDGADKLREGSRIKAVKVDNIAMEAASEASTAPADSKSHGMRQAK